MTRFDSPKQTSFDREPFLEQLDFSPPQHIFALGRIRVDRATLGEHRLIAYETGVLPNIVQYDSEGILHMEINQSCLDLEDRTLDEFKAALEKILVPKFNVRVFNDLEKDV